VKAVKAKLLYTGRPESPLRDKYLAFEGSKIVGVYDEAPEGAEVVLEAEVVTPAFIDGHSHIGMARSGEPSEEGETNERFDSIVALADALESIYMDDKAFRESVESGVLYSCVLPGSGNLIGGRAVVIRNYAENIRDAFIAYAGVKAALGFNPRRTVEWKGTRPHTRMGAYALLRRRLLEAVKADELVRIGKKHPAEIDPETEALIRIVRGVERLRVHVHKADDAYVLLKLKEEFSLKVTAEHLCDVHEARTFRALREAGVPIVYGPLDAFPYKVELKHESWRNVKYLIESGAKFCLMSDHPVTLQRNLYLQLRFLLRSGLRRWEAISKITKEAAEILGIADKLGTLEEGRWASFVAWSGDPFSLESYPVAVYAEGRLVHEE